MKTIDAATIIDFLRRILETNYLENIEVSSTSFSKHICYNISENKYISLFIYEDNDIRLVISEELEKEIEFSTDEKTELFYYFNRIYKVKEDRAYKVIDGLCRYTNINGSNY